MLKPIRWTRSAAAAASLVLSGCVGGTFGSEGLLSGPAAPGDSVVVLAAGDIADCRRGGDEETAAILDTLPGVVIALGDNAYPHGSPAQYRDCYAPTWGAYLRRTWAVAGNHDYQTPHAAGLFGFFGERAGPPGRGYYSVDLPRWHLVVLNSNIPMTPASPQGAWLARDLAEHPGDCTLAVIHHPRYSSGIHGNHSSVAPVWRALQAAGADVILSGHDHVYERFVRMGPDGRPDPDHGLRSFVVGTGGARHYGFVRRAPGSAVRLRGTWGVLRLRLRPGRYEWDFLTADGRSLDHGEDVCR